MTNYIGDWLLDIVSISTNRSKDEFDAEQIEAIAHSIINLGGVINPLIVRKTGYNSDGEEVYELVEGHLEFLSARKAMEIDPKLEMIRAFVMEPAQEYYIHEQIRLLRGSIEAKIPIDYEYLISQIENRVTHKFQPLFVDIQQRLAKLASNLEQSSPIADIQQKETSLITAINDLTVSELRRKLDYARLQEKTLDNLLANRPYDSKTDLCKRVKGIKEKTYHKILTGWHG